MAQLRDHSDHWKECVLGHRNAQDYIYIGGEEKLV